MAFDPLLLENQLCFPLYACAREVTKRYKPFLDEIGLTYTQYITMMVLWERKRVNVKTLGEALYLDSGTLTPLLKKLESAGLIARTRSATDERNVIVSLTALGEKKRQEALSVPTKIAKCIQITPDDAVTLHRILHDILRTPDQNEEDFS